MARGDIRLFHETFHAYRYLKSIIYGGLDGIVTTFAVVAGVAGASLNSNIILILGLANLIGDGISMAIGDYLSSKAYIEYHENDNKNNKSNKKVNRKELIPFKNALATFLSFVIFGFIPLIAFVLSYFINIPNILFISLLLSAIALFTLGSLKYRITGKHWLRSGFEMVLVGSMAAGAAYLVGKIVAGIV